MRKPRTHCPAGHTYTGHKTSKGHNLCLLCLEATKKDLARLREKSKAFSDEMEIEYDPEPPTALAQLAQQWDKTVNDYARVFSPERAARHFGLELETVKDVLLGRSDNR